MSTLSHTESSPDLFAHLEARGLLGDAVRRLKQFAGLGIVLAVLAGTLSPGGLTGLILDVWTAIGLALAVGSGLVWLSARTYADGDLPPPDARSIEDGNLPVIGAALATGFARRAHSSAGARVLWEATFGSGSLPPTGLADASDTIDEDAIRSVRRTLRRLALASVGLIVIDLAVRYPKDIAAVLGLVDRQGILSLTDVTLTPVEWLGVYGAVVTVGALIGFLLAVTYR